MFCDEGSAPSVRFALWCDAGSAGIRPGQHRQSRRTRLTAPPRQIERGMLCWGGWMVRARSPFMKPDRWQLNLRDASFGIE